MTEQYAVGVDIGGTKIAFALVDRAGNVLRADSVPCLPAEGAAAVFDRTANGIHRLVGADAHHIAGIGIGSPGYLNPHTGFIYGATNLFWRNVPLVDEIRRRVQLDTPVYLQKDADAAVLGELYFGAGRGHSNFAHFTVGTGIGGGAVMHGDLVQGTHFNQMEVGHIPLRAGGRRCVCGMIGCPEIYAGGVGLIAAAREYLPDYRDSVLAHADAITTAAILDAARTGDPLAGRIMREAVDALVAVVLSYIGFFDPALITMGGGLAHAASEWYIDALNSEIRARRAVLMDLNYPDIPIVPSQIASSAVGAASLVWHRRAQHTPPPDPLPEFREGE